MPRILSVDDSRAIRAMITKALRDVGYDVDEAEDGQQGLARLEECQYDLVLLDVTMPVLDGPGMLDAMRKTGNKTPVLMLTSESKRSIVSTVMQLGISDYILKPFKPEDLLAKVAKATGAAPPKLNAVESAQAAVLAAAPPPAESAPTGARAFVDVLVIDDMENVHKKLKTVLPAHITTGSAMSGRAALQTARERIFRLILVDLDLPDVNSATLLQQLRTLQPHAACVALTLRSTTVDSRIKDEGFDGVLHKPFDPTELDELLQRYFDNQELVVRDNNCLRVAAFNGKEDRIERYFERISELTNKSLEDIAAACFDETIVDVTKLPIRPDRTPKLVQTLQASTSKLGMELRLVGPPELKKLLETFAETNSIPYYASLEAAQAS